MGPSAEAPEAVIGASLRTADLYRVNYDVRELKPFACLAFPHLVSLEKPQRQPSFGDQLVTSF